MQSETSRDMFADIESVPDDRSSAEILNVTLDGFEGPLDLLLALARKQKVDLREISILALVEQYLGFIAEARRLRLEIAADYLVVAAWLAFLKSKLLLPKEDKPEDGPSGSELAAQLAFRLKRLEAMRDVLARIMTRRRLGVDIFGRGMPEGVRTVRSGSYTATVYDLLKAYAEQRRRTAVAPHKAGGRTVWSIKEGRELLARLMGDVSDWAPIDHYLAGYLDEPEIGRTALASAFGATLELTREGYLEIRQATPFGPLRLHWKRRPEGYEDAAAQAELFSRAEAAQVRQQSGRKALGSGGPAKSRAISEGDKEAG